MPIYQSSVLQKYLSHQVEDDIKVAYQRYTAYFHDPKRQAQIRALKEEQFQEGFLRELFVKVLGYTINPDPDFNLTTELKNVGNAKKTDGAILRNGKALAVIELKGTDTRDLSKVNAQAFDYKNNQPECTYVVTSNFEKLRFFIHHAVEHVEFNLFQLTYHRFSLLWLFLQKDNLLGDIPLKVQKESLLKEEEITKRLYKDYASFKQELWQDMVKNNPHADELELYKKSQKLLDRFLFIFFAEDKGLLPPNSISVVLSQFEKLRDLDEYRPLYERFQKYFGYMNTGFVGKKYTIEAYNGGLFKPDPMLDDLTIGDEVLKRHTLKLSEYDFQTEVDVNILGHIFEHSLNDIENVRAELAGETVDKSKTKRKKDGVFYTPKYITKYIVDHTVGRLCEEKKAEIGIDEAEFAKSRKGRKKATLEKLDKQLKDYRTWLLQITICDPACGSGAFLNQALNFLIEEHRYIDELEAALLEAPMIFPDVESRILEQNIYGVDINEESVEIARLSLWLRTAKKGRKLNSLSNHIKVGNSLIDDAAVAGDLAFDWEKEFPKVFTNGGFDVVIGNPPYVDIKALQNEIVEYLFKNFISANNRVNLYTSFIEKSTALLKDAGRFSFIIPSSLLTQSSYGNLRKLLLDKTSISEIVRLPNESFGASAGEVKVDTIIFSFSNKRKRQSKTRVLIYPGFDRIEEIGPTNAVISFDIHSSKWRNNGDSIFSINTTPEIQNILNKCEKDSITLLSCADLCLGLTPYDKYKGHSPSQIKDRVFHSDFKKDDTFHKLLAGNDIRRYNVSWGGNEWISYGDWLGAAREQRFFTEKRILVKQIIDWSDKRIWAALTVEELYNTQNAFNIVPNSNCIAEYLIALINSKLISFYHKKKFLEEYKDRFQKILIKEAKLLPIRVLSIEQQQNYVPHVDKIIDSSKKLVLLIENLVELVQSKFPIPKPSKKLQDWPSLTFAGFLGELKKQQVKLSLEKEAEWMDYFTKKQTEALALQSEIDRLDREIDEMVYDLYGLTEEERKVVEGT